MRITSLSGLLIITALATLPSAALATNIQSFDGSDTVYMDYPNGIDELLVNNYNTDSHLSLDIYQSADAITADSWTLDRSYTSEDFTDENAENSYSFSTQPALHFNKDWYFTMHVQSLGEFSTIPESIQVWKIDKRGSKPERVLDVADGSYSYFSHSSLVELNDTLVFISPTGEVHTSADGSDWSYSHTITEVTEHGAAEDLISNGSKLYLAIDGTVYSSTDAMDWTVVTDLCAEEEISCAVEQIALRPNKGLFAVTSTVDEEYNSTYHLWVYKKGLWTETTATTHYISALRTFGQHTYALFSRGTAGYQYSLSELKSNGELETVIPKRAGTGMGLVTKQLLMINPKDASYVNLVSY